MPISSNEIGLLWPMYKPIAIRLVKLPRGQVNGRHGAYYHERESSFDTQSGVFFHVKYVRVWEKVDTQYIPWNTHQRCFVCHDDVIKWKHFPRYWSFVWGIHRWLVNSPHKGQWRGALMFSLICSWINGWVNHREAGDLKGHCAHCDVIVMCFMSFSKNSFDRFIHTFLVASIGLLALLPQFYGYNCNIQIWTILHMKTTKIIKHKQVWGINLERHYMRKWPYFLITVTSH